ncbi:MAG TPA: flagellar basal body-associated FliL family protein [Novimethylophilus sp.]|jgi:flagellar basal body-associated protein FliL|uniref:flagellar basal body-associated FliL family protein n=1 Tax=Novimethylophilus sp. TaxID=2137426 RepID=UPI002F3E530A
MRIKLIAFIFTITISLLAVGVVAFYYINKNDAARSHQEQWEEKAADLTSKVEVFNMILPCKPAPDGSTVIAHADMVLDVPLKSRLTIEQSNSKLRDIISTVFRSSSIADLNADSDLKKLKNQITEKIKSELNIRVLDILFLRFDYDVLESRGG